MENIGGTLWKALSVKQEFLPWVRYHTLWYQEQCWENQGRREKATQEETHESQILSPDSNHWSSTPAETSPLLLMPIGQALQASPLHCHQASAFQQPLSIPCCRLWCQSYPINAPMVGMARHFILSRNYVAHWTVAALSACHLWLGQSGTQWQCRMIHKFPQEGRYFGAMEWDQK